jgi:hypothetical protein
VTHISQNRAEARLQKPTIVIRLQPRPDSDGVQALKWILKTWLRRFGLKCLELREEPAADQPEAEWREWPPSE